MLCICSLIVKINAQGFGPPQRISPIELPGTLSPTLVDCDGDGDLDISGHFIRGGIWESVFIENVGTKEQFDFEFASAEMYNAGPVTQNSVFNAAGDLDNDGDDDVLQMSFDDELGETSIHFIENSNGNFLPPVSFVIGNTLEIYFALDPALIDWDGDGDLDLLGMGIDPLAFTSTERYLSALMFVENLGTPEQFTPNAIAVNPGEFVGYEMSDAQINAAGLNMLEAGDFDNDNDIDIIYFSWTNDDTVLGCIVIYYENQDGILVKGPNLIDIEGVNGYVLPTSGDLDGDGDLDLLFETLNNDSNTNETDLFWCENLGPISSTNNTNKEEHIHVTVDYQNKSLIINYSDEGVWSIFNANGQVLNSSYKNSTTNQVQMDITHLTPGIYFVSNGKNARPFFYSPNQ